MDKTGTSQQTEIASGGVGQVAATATIQMRVSNGTLFTLVPAVPAFAVAVGQQTTAPDTIKGEDRGSAGSYAAAPGLLEQGISCLSAYMAPGNKDFICFAAMVNPDGQNVVKVAVLNAKEFDINAQLVKTIIANSKYGSSAEIKYKDEFNVPSVMTLIGGINTMMNATATFNIAPKF